MGDSIYQWDPALGYVLRPGIDEGFIFGTRVKTNRLGLRDREYGPKRPGEFRILSLGDSYAFGYGVESEQSYTKLVEQGLRERYRGLDLSVIDAGVTGYGTAQQRLAFQQLGPKLQVDFVLATFTASNDVYDDAVFQERLRTHLQTPLGTIGRHSHAARLLLKVTFPLWFFLENRDPANIEHTIQLLNALEGDFKRAGTPYLMLVIPARHQIRPSVKLPVQILMDIGFEDLVFRQNRVVLEHFRLGGVPYLDLWRVLAARDSVVRVSFEEDSHLNPLGHAVVAQAILGRLGEILPPLLSQAR